MYNWSVDLTRLKQNPEAYERFCLEQLINFGLNDEKISLTLLKKHWKHLQLDPHKKKYLQSLLWPETS